MEFIEAWRAVSPGTYYLYAVVLGMSMGSFINVLAYRLPRKIDAMHLEGLREELLRIDSRAAQKVPDPDWSHTALGGRSYCPHCRAKIPLWYNIPIVSYLYLKARSRCCNKKISIQYLSVEIFAALLTLVIFHSFEPLSALWISIGFWLTLSLLLCDLNSFYLPNELVFSLWGLGILGAYFGIGSISFEKSVLASMMGFSFLYLVAAIYGKIKGYPVMGGGDPKLLGAISAWTGLVLPVLFSACMITAMSWLLLGKRKEDPLPFGPGIVLGGWIAFFIAWHLNNNILIGGIL